MLKLVCHSPAGQEIRNLMFSMHDRALYNCSGRVVLFQVLTHTHTHTNTHIHITDSLIQLEKERDRQTDCRFYGQDLKVNK
jgi:hypothetical protein